MKSSDVVNAPAGVVTVMGPVAAPSGTCTQTPCAEATTNSVAGVPLKLTALVLKKFAPNKSIVFPGAAELGPSPTFAKLTA